MWTQLLVYLDKWLTAFFSLFLGGKLVDETGRRSQAEAEIAELRQRIADAEELSRLSGPERDERMRAAEDRVRELQSSAPKRG